MQCRVRQARRNGALVVEVINPQVVYERDAGICGICLSAVARDSAWQVDHVVPLSSGGAHTYGNVQLTHARCNYLKGKKPMTHGSVLALRKAG